jgi:hypothetical protein
MEFSFSLCFLGSFVLKGGRSVCVWHRSVDLGCEMELVFASNWRAVTVFTLLETLLFWLFFCMIYNLDLTSFLL